MTKSASLDFNIQRNEDFGPFSFVILATDKKPVGIREWNFSLAIDVRPGLTAAPLLTITQFPNGNGSYIAVEDPDAGALELFVSRMDVAALQGQVGSFVGFFHNLIGSDELGYERVIARGVFIAEPGV